jgi:hypothetical protein
MGLLQEPYIHDALELSRHQSSGSLNHEAALEGGDDVLGFFQTLLEWDLKSRRNLNAPGRDFVIESATKSEGRSR